MSTNDVPGANPVNHDQLAMGCWAEHADGSLIFVESTEGGRVIYLMFDVAKSPPVEYRDAMPEASFKTTFTWGKGSKERWTWHDKTPFPWDRVIKNGFPDGEKSVSADDQLTAAERVAESLRLRGARISRDQYRDRMQDVRSGPDTASIIMDKLGRAFAELMK